eukprot:scaffold175761_cov30-Prasinocladus_malaysianus.AAC.1
MKPSDGKLQERVSCFSNEVHAVQGCLPGGCACCAGGGAGAGVGAGGAVPAILAHDMPVGPGTLGAGAGALDGAGPPFPAEAAGGGPAAAGAIGAEFEAGPAETMHGPCQ